MKIVVTDKYYLETDAHNLIVKEKQDKIDKKGNPVADPVHGYFGKTNLDMAVKKICILVLEDNHKADVTTLRGYIDEFRTLMDELLEIARL